METLIDNALPALLDLLGIILAALLAWAAAAAKRKFGIDVEARHREALHSALMTGARLALARQLTGAAAVELIVTHARESVSDAIGHLQPTGDFLERMAEAKLQEAGDKLARELSRAIGR